MSSRVIRIYEGVRQAEIPCWKQQGPGTEALFPPAGRTKCLFLCVSMPSG